MIRTERYLCRSCNSLMDGGATRMQYSPTKRRVCPRCGSPVEKLRTWKALRYVDDLLKAGNVAVRERPSIAPNPVPETSRR